MAREIFLGIIFIATCLVQASFINALGYPLYLISLPFIIGTLVLHRAGSEIGAVWFFFTALSLPLLGFDNHIWWTYIVTAGFGIFLTTRLFTTRSLYALEGLGVTMFTAFFVLNRLTKWIMTNFNDTNYVLEHPLLNSFVVSIFFLVIGLYFGFLFAKFIERMASEVFLIKR